MKAHAIVLLGCAWMVWQVAVDVNTTRLTYTPGRQRRRKVPAKPPLAASKPR